VQIDQITHRHHAGIAPPAASLAGLEPLKTIKSRWPTIIGGMLTCAMLVGIGHELFAYGMAGLGKAVPRNPLFYLIFAIMYVVPPLADYAIFRRLWRIPLAGLVALIKKRIANDVVVGYSGEAYFYAWARQRAHLVAAPFGAVKDVSILSAIAGNTITLMMIAVALLVGSSLIPREMLPYVHGSLAVIFATSIPFLVFSRRVFSLGARDLWTVFAIHCGRLILGALLLASAWALALPAVTLGTWVFLSAGRLLFSRLPLLPNKDLLFANFAILVIGEDRALSELIAFTAAAILVVHLLLITVFGIHAMMTRKQA